MCRKSWTYLEGNVIEEKCWKGLGFITRKEPEDVSRRDTKAHETRLQQFSCLYFVSVRSKACSLTSVMAWNERMLWLRVGCMECLFSSVVLAGTIFSLSPVSFLGCLWNCCLSSCFDKVQSKEVDDIWGREWAITLIVVFHCCPFLRALDIFIEDPLDLSLAVFGVFLTPIPLHKSINCLCFFLCLQVSVCHSGLLLLWSGFGSKLQSTHLPQTFLF